MYKPNPDYYADEDISDLVSAADKGKAPYLIAMADELISRLVTGRPDLRHLRDLYEARRSPQAFAHLTHNYGIGNPGRVPFIPIVRNRIEYLKGKYLEAGIPHKVGCSNAFSMGLAQQEKVAFFLKEISQRLGNDISQQATAAQQGGEPTPMSLNQEEIARIAEHGKKFQSSLEIDSQHVLTDIIENPEYRTLTHMEKHLENLLVEGETGFDTRPGEPGMLAEHHVIPAEQLYCDAPRKSRFSETATCFVRRERMSIQHVLSLHGHKISAEERRTIAGRHCIGGMWESMPLGAEKYLDFYRTETGDMAFQTDQYRNWVTQQDGNPSNMVEVFTVQWIATNEINLDKTPEEIPAAVQELGLAPELISKGRAHGLNNVAPGAKAKKNVRYRQDLYEVVRIGSNIYPDMGKIENPVRPVNEPWRVRPTFRRYYLDLSLLSAASDSQDRSDIMHYFMENAGAMSGTKGSITPTSDIPLELGNTIQERIQASAGYRKLGQQLINPMQAGGTKGQFSNYQSFDDTIKGDTFTGFKMAIDLYDDTVSNLTGVNRQMLGDIAERDGKAVTEQAVTGGTVVTRPIFTLFDILMGDAFTDQLNYSRQSIKLAAQPGGNNLVRLGQSGIRTFTIDADKFALGHFNVTVRNGQKERKQLENMTNMAKEFAVNQLLPPEEAIDSLFYDSVTEAREHLIGKLREGSAAKMQQLTQENEQLKKQMEQLQKQAESSSGMQDQIAQAQVQQESQRIAIEDRAQRTDAAQGERELELDAQRVALERDQAVVNAPKQSAEIRNN